jgi:hypothetical protein
MNKKVLEEQYGLASASSGSQPTDPVEACRLANTVAAVLPRSVTGAGIDTPSSMLLDNAGSATASPAKNPEIQSA